MADDNKINVDITVSGDAQKQIENYIKSFDNLRSSINGLSQPFNSFSNSLNNLDKNLSKYADSLNQINGQHQEFVSTGDKVDEKILKVSNSFTSWLGVIRLFVDTMKGWQVALTGGLSIIVAFLPEIINFAKALFTGTDAINAMAVNFKNLNDVMKDANKDAASEITRLQVLYKSATDVNSTYDDRLNSVKELRKEFPAHFKGISDENILNGNSKKTYDQLTRSIFDNAKAKAALNKITDQAGKVLDAEFQIQKIQNANFNEKRRYENEAAEGGNAKKALAYYKEESDKRARIAIAEQNEIKKSAENTVVYLTKLAGGAGKLSRVITNNDSNSTVTNPPVVRSAKPTPSPSPKPAPETFPHINDEILTAKATTLTKQIEQDKQHYDTEMAMLQDQLAKKLITQADYNTQSTQLQDKFHQGLGTMVTTFRKEDLDEAQKHLQAISDVSRLEGKIGKDEKDVKNAILPGAKLDAEKQLVTDKYDYEIALAYGNTEKIKQLEVDKQKALTDVAQQYEQQRKEFALNTAQQVSDKAFSIISNNIKSQSDAKIKGLEAQKASELNNTSLTATQRKAIEDKYKQKEAQEKVKAFKAEQRASVLQAIVNGALAITKATAQTGILAAFVIPGIIASTALQVATIVSQKPPAFAKGGRFVSDGRGALLPGYSRTDNTNAFLRSGEAVVVSEAMRNPWARNLVSAINVAHGGRDFSVPNTGRGYAIGGIYTDGGNANRYYNQPVNDIKDMANTLAYQMINNFPPIYVDVKDVNNQQNILAQTVNRVNL